MSGVFPGRDKLSNPKTQKYITTLRCNQTSINLLKYLVASATPCDREKGAEDNDALDRNTLVRELVYSLSTGIVRLVDTPARAS